MNRPFAILKDLLPPREPVRGDRNRGKGSAKRGPGDRKPGPSAGKPEARPEERQSATAAEATGASRAQARGRNELEQRPGSKPGEGQRRDAERGQGRGQNPSANQGQTRNPGQGRRAQAGQGGQNPPNTRSPRNPNRNPSATTSGDDVSAAHPAQVRGPNDKRAAPGAPRPVNPQREKHLALAAEGLRALQAQFPTLFNRQRPVPLAIGIHKPLLAAVTAGELTASAAAVRAAIGRWTGSLHYLACLKADAPRHDLQGNPQGAVTVEQAEAAQAQWEQRQARRQKKRSGQPPTAEGGKARDGRARRQSGAPQTTQDARPAQPVAMPDAAPAARTTATPTPRAAHEAVYDCIVF